MQIRLAAAVLLVAASASSALAHGGGYGKTPGGPQASPGFGEPPIDTDGKFGKGGPETRWETWWTANREDLLQIAERVDAPFPMVVTPGATEAVFARPDPAKKRAARAARVRDVVLPVLLRALEDRDFDVRCSAAVALGKTGDPSVAAPLRNASKRDPRDDVRRAAFLALGILGRIDELPFLADVVRDKTREPDERAMALLAVGLVGGPDAAMFLADFAAKCRAKSETPTQAEAQLLGTAYAALGVAGDPEGVRALASAADDDALDPFLRGHAVLSLGRLRDRGSILRLVGLLAPTRDVQLRRCAALALGRIVTGTDAEAVAALTASADGDSDPAARRMAIQSLGFARSAAVRDALLARFRTTTSDRAAFALALGLQKDPIVAPTIRDALATEKDVSIRSALCMALGLLADKASAGALEEQLAAPPARGPHRGFAAVALAVLPSLASAPAIYKTLQDETDPRVRSDCAVALGLLNDGRAKAFLLEQMRTAVGVFDKCTAMECLGVLRRADVVPDLVAVVENPNADGIVRAVAVVALGQIADPSLVPRLSRLSAGGSVSFATRALAEALGIL